MYTLSPAKAVTTSLDSEIARSIEQYRISLHKVIQNHPLFSFKGLQKNEVTILS